MTTPRPLVLALLLAAVALAPPAAGAADAGSLGVTPASVSVPDAQAGETYERRVTVQNAFPTAKRVNLELRGDAGAWTTTREGDAVTVPSHDTAVVRLTIRVPEDAYVGPRTGALAVVADPVDQPPGSGLAVRQAITVPLSVTVSGEPVERLRWVDARAPDVETGSPPVVHVTVANAGNVRTTAAFTVQILGFEDEHVIMESTGRADLIPGSATDMSVTFADTLPEGQYRVRVRAADAGAFERVLELKSLPPGSLGKDGALRFLKHEPRAAPGAPVRVDAVFENTGAAPIARARFTGEVHVNGRLVATLESEPLVVRAGELVNLTAFFTPNAPGTHEITGVVTYDGFTTRTGESLLDVQNATAGRNWRLIPSWAPLLVAASALAAAVALSGRVMRGRTR